MRTRVKQLFRSKEAYQKKKSPLWGGFEPIVLRLSLVF